MWQLCKVLPGQRNGAQRWFQDFTAVLSLGFSQCVAMPSVSRHRTRRVVLNVHVDDELIAAEQASDIEWLVQELQEIYNVQVEGPVPREPLGSGEELNYLKKVHVFAEDGVYIKSNPKHVESLLRLHESDGRKEKQVPEHCLLGQPNTSPELDSKRQVVFWSGLGIAMYMSHDRCDIQYCVKTLASSMKTPTEHAERCLIQLILYLKGTQGFAFKLSYTPVGTSLASKLNHAPELDQDDNIHVMEVFCDSDWAGSLYRESTTSVMILLNGLLALPYSRTQKAVALSSCEAEVLALTSGVSEAILLRVD